MTYFNKCTDSKISGHIRQHFDGITIGAIVGVVSVSVLSFFAIGINAKLGPPLRFLLQTEINKDLS